MIGLVLVTHGRLAVEFITAMEHVVGPQEAVDANALDRFLRPDHMLHCRDELDREPAVGHQH